MKKILSIFTAILFAGSMFAAEGDKHDYPQSFSQLLNNNASIASINIEKPAFPVKEVIISWRYNKDIANAVTMEVSVGGTSWGTEDVNENTGTNYTTTSFTHESAEGAIQIDFTNNTGGGTGHGTFYVNKITLVEGAISGIVKTLKSIAVSDMTTEFEQFDKFSFDGVCKATYSVIIDEVAQPDEERTVTPTSVSEPDMNTAGKKEVTVSFTDGEITKEAKYEINVKEHVVTPGTYDIALTNTFFGTKVNTNITEAVSATYNDVTVELNWIEEEASIKPRTDATYVRIYVGNTLTLSVPEGYKITAVVFTTEDDYGKPTPSAGAFDEEDDKAWAGEARSLTFKFSTKSFIDAAKVTYVAGEPTALSNTEVNATAVKTIVNGQLIIEKDGVRYNVFGTRL